MILLHTYEYMKFIWKLILGIHLCPRNTCKGIFRHKRNAHIQISLDVRKPTFRYASNEDSDQPAHSHSLIRLFTGHILDSQGHEVTSYGQRRLIRLRRCAGLFESLLDEQVRKYVFSRSSSNHPAHLAKKRYLEIYAIN